MTMWGMPAAEQEGFASTRRRATSGYGTAQATNAYKRSSALANQTAASAALGRQWQSGRNKLPGDFNNRGLLNSGIYQQGMQDSAVEKELSYGALGRQYQQMLGGLEMERQGADVNYYNEMADNDAQERARRAYYAQQYRTGM